MTETKTITLTSLFAGLIFIFTAYISHIPTGVGYVHFGDAFIYLAACLLPRKYAMMAAAIGAGLADIATGGMLWVLPTIIIKPCLVAMFSRDCNMLAKRNIIACVVAGIFGVLAYFVAEVIIFGNYAVAVANFASGFIQPVGSMIFFILIATALNGLKIGVKNDNTL
ncbi:MAG: TIGR04002 family protein [Bacillota bacterium]